MNLLFFHHTLSQTVRKKQANMKEEGDGFGLHLHHDGSFLFILRLFAILSFMTGCLFTRPVFVLSTPPAHESPQPGLVWVLFHSPNLTRTQEIGVDPSVDVDTGTSVRDYSKLWMGLLKSPTDSPLILYAEADNGCRLFIGGRLVMDSWATPGIHQATVMPPKDAYLPLRLEYFQDGGTGHMRLLWSWKGKTRELIPASAFFHSTRQQQEVMAIAQKKQAVKMPPVREDRSEIYSPSSDPKPPPKVSQEPVPVHPGPHLFIDDHLIESSCNSVRLVVQPARDYSLPNPLVTGSEDRCFQPFFTVLRSPETGRYRLWYGSWKDDQKEGT